MQYDDREEIELMRETELKDALANYKKKYDDTTQELIDTKAKIEEYKRDDKSEEDAIALLEEEIKQTNMQLGNTAVKGEGIVITMKDNIEYGEEESAIIDSVDLIDLINELKYAGAEAISINGQRIVSTTNIFKVGEQIMYINGQRTSSPYEIKAIGDKKHLEAALSINGGFLDSYTLNNYLIDMEVKDEILINKYDGNMTLKYVKSK